jgi:hypothetical protein
MRIKVRTILAVALFFFSFKLAAAHMTTPSMITNGIVFFFAGVWIAIVSDKDARGCPNEFGIPTRKPR